MCVCVLNVGVYVHKRSCRRTPCPRERATACPTGRRRRRTQNAHANTLTPTHTHTRRRRPQANYGLKDAAAVAKVKAVYDDLGMRGRFEQYEADSHSRLTRLIEEQGMLPRGVFTNLLAKIYKRQK